MDWVKTTARRERSIWVLRFGVPSMRDLMVIHRLHWIASCEPFISGQSILVQCLSSISYGYDWCCRADSRFATSQWETPLLCNNVSHWLGAKPRVSPVLLFCVTVHKILPLANCIWIHWSWKALYLTMQLLSIKSIDWTTLPIWHV